MAYNILKTLPAVIQTALGLKQNTPRVVTSSTQASIDEILHVTATSTISDPASPTEGKGFEVLVRAGTATVGGTAYSQAGLIIRRVYHSGSYTNYVDRGGVLATDTTAGVVQIGGTAAGNAATVGQLYMRRDVSLRDFAVTTASGGGSLALPLCLRINTGTAGSGTVIARSRGANGSQVVNIGGGQEVVNWSRAIGFSILMTTAVTTPSSTHIFRAQLGRSDNTTLGDLDKRGIGFKIVQRRIWLLQHNGTALSQTDTGQDITHLENFRVEVWSDGAGNVSIWYNGAQLGSPVAGGPTGVDPTIGLIAVEAQQGAATTDTWYIMQEQVPLFAA
jgi:hypothetical protein